MRRKLLLTLLLVLTCGPICFGASTATVCDTDTKLWLHADGADESTTFTDSSTNAKTVTAYGGTQLDTAQKKFGTASGLFDGNADYLSLADSDDWDFGTGDYTIDFQVRFNNVSSNRTFFDIGKYTSAAGILFEFHSKNRLYLYHNGNGNQTSFSWSPSINTWYHIALVRTSGTVKCFVDGTQVGSDWSNATNIQSGTFGAKIGTYYDGSQDPMNGWIDELRIVKGTAVWTSNFTPPSSAYSSPSVRGRIHVS